MCFVKQCGLRLLALAVITCVTGCDSRVNNDGSDTSARALLKATSATALSRHYVQVRLDAPVQSGAVRPDAFRIRATEDRADLRVLDAEVMEDSATVVLVTEAQEPRSYELTTHNAESTANGVASVSQGILFNGSMLDEPQLLNAVALSSTTVLLTFSEPMNPVTAEVASFYHILDPDGEPDIDISVVSAQLGPEGTTVTLTTTEQENREYTVILSNVDAAYNSSGTCRGTQFNLSSSTTQCAATIRPADPNGGAAPFSFTARTRVASSAPLDPDAAGNAGNVVMAFSGVGVASTSCFGSQSISGSGTDSNEELILTFDFPVQHEIITLGFFDFSLVSDNPVLFASSDSQAGFDFTIPEADIQAGLSVIDAQSGRIYLGAMAPLPTGQFVDVLKIRETASRTNLVSVCLAASRRLDPDSREATFFGIPADDSVGPVVVSAVPTDIDTVLVSFSEPLRDGAADPLNFEIAPGLTVIAAEATRFNTQMILTTTPMSQGVEYTLTVSQVQDLAGNVIGSGSVASSHTAMFVFPGGPVFNGDERPRVVGAISTSNSSVIVTFSKPMGDSALEAEHYAIRREGNDPPGGFLGITAAEWHTIGSRNAVRLTTTAQTDILYRLTVVNVQDLQGNQLAPAELLVDPTSVTFRGTAPPCPACSNGALGLDGSGSCQTDAHCDDDPPCNAAEADCEGVCVDACSSRDSDGDGLPDEAELSGWVIVVVDANGNQQTLHVTSNPNVADSDGDGVLDLDERVYGCNPRRADTDADLLTDFDELNLWYSDPWNQDTDGDSFIDGLDVAFETSPILADTDGDQMDDAEELIERNRNPLIADMPLPQVTVGEFSLALDVTSSFTDEEGVTQSQSTTNSATFTQSQTNTLGTSETNSTQSENTFGQKIGVEGGTAGFKISGEVSFGQSQARGYSSTVDSQSSATAQQEHQESVTQALEFSESRSVTRSIDAAIVQATVNISNNSDIAFSISNIELSMLQQDRTTGLTFRPIAALRPTGADDPLSQPTYNIAPLEQERGPIIFENTSIFPNRVDDLMREPTGLLFKVVNYDVLDEFGRNLVFTTQEVIDKTVAITVDYGDGRVELYRVATASVYGPDARQVGISMERALEIAGLTHDAVASTDTNTYATRDDIRPNPNGGGNITVEALVRVRDVSNSPDGKKFWTAVSSNLDLDPNSDFRSIQLHARDTYLIMYTSDVDGDKLFLREEYLYGSDDTLVDTDGDGLGDFEEVRVGWTVPKVPGLPYKTFPSPARPDSDLDGLEDQEEKKALTDPNRSDTDEDGRSDASEIHDTYTIALFDPDAGPADPPVVLTVTPYSDWAITAGADGTCDTTTAASDDEVVTLNGTGSKLCIGPGPNGIIDTVPSDDDTVVAAPKIDPGPDGICQTTTASGDDVVEFSDANNPPVKSTIGKVCISAGLDDELDTTPAADSDDFVRAVHRAQLIAIVPGTDGECDTTTASGDDVLAFSTATQPGIDPIFGAVCVLVGSNLVLETTAAGDDVALARNGVFGTDPVKSDTDTDGINDGREVILGINPNAQDAGSVTDTDGDGLFDDEEALCGADKNLADTDRDGIPDVIECKMGFDPNSLDSDGDTLLDYLEFDTANPLVNGTPMFNAVTLSIALTKCDDATNCSYTAPPISLNTSTHPDRADTDGDGRNDNVELQTPCVYTVFGGSATQVFSDPLFAESEQSVGQPTDGLNDSQECLATNGTNPLDPDTDDDLRNDGAEGPAGLNPLRKDKKINVKLTTILVNDDCDGDSLEGMELFGAFLLEYPVATGFSDFEFYNPPCPGEEGACGISDCCISEGDGQACPGESWSVNTTSSTFVFRDGDSFKLKSTVLRDNDDLGGCGGLLRDTIGTMNTTIDFAVSLSTSQAIGVGSGGCMITANYTVTIVN